MSGRHRFEGCGDLGAEQVEVGMGGVFGLEWVKSKSLPPCASVLVEGGDDYGSAGGFGVEVRGCREDMGDQGGADPESGVPAIDGEAAEKECGNGVGSAFSDAVWGVAAVDCGHGQARICDGFALGCGDYPGRRGVASPVLSCVATEPFVQLGLAGIEVAAVAPRCVKRFGSEEVSQPSGTGGGVRGVRPVARSRGRAGRALR